MKADESFVLLLKIAVRRMVEIMREALEAQGHSILDVQPTTAREAAHNMVEQESSPKPDGYMHEWETGGIYATAFEVEWRNQQRLQKRKGKTSRETSTHSPC